MVDDLKCRGPLVLSTHVNGFNEGLELVFRYFTCEIALYGRSSDGLPGVLLARVELSRSRLVKFAIGDIKTLLCSLDKDYCPVSLP